MQIPALALYEHKGAFYHGGWGAAIICISGAGIPRYDDGVDIRPYVLPISTWEAETGALIRLKGNWGSTVPTKSTTVRHAVVTKPPCFSGGGGWWWCYLAFFVGAVWALQVRTTEN